MDEPLSPVEWISALAIGMTTTALVLWLLVMRWVRRPKERWP